MITIGITGGIGSGKSCVCAYLQERYQACVLMADEIGHEVMAPDGCAYEALVALLGKEYLKEDGTIDRKKTGDRVFREPETLDRMNEIIHPAVHRTILERAAAAEEAGRDLCVIEAALLIEADYRDLCREYWYVHTDEETRMQRLLASRDITPAKVQDIMERQLPEEQFRKACKFELENGSDFAATAAAIDDRIAYLRAQA